MNFDVTGSTSAAKIGEVLLSEPDETTVIDGLVDQRRRHGPLCEQRAERLAFVESEGCDIHQAGDAWRVGTEGGDDLAAVGMADDDRRAACRART